MNTVAILPAMLAVSLISCATYNEAPDAPSISQNTSSQQSNPLIASLTAAGPARAELSGTEQDLYNLLMQYRREHGLPPIPVSKSLSFVAKLHVRDLEKNTVPAPYNFHSWSKNGPWKSVSYTADHRSAKMMYDKPRELTSYQGNGYEIVYMNSGSARSLDAFSLWKASKPHNAVITNADDWKRMQWQAVGVGVFGRYAAVWFGDKIDPNTEQIELAPRHEAMAGIRPTAGKRPNLGRAVSDAYGG